MHNRFHDFMTNIHERITILNTLFPVCGNVVDSRQMDESMTLNTSLFTTIQILLLMHKNWIEKRRHTMTINNGNKYTECIQTYK